MNYFLNHISNNFEEIKQNFKRGLSKQGYPFDEDMLSDVILKCNSKLYDKYMTKKDSIKYLWVSYLNNFKNNIKKHKEDIGIPEKFDIETNEYDLDIDILCDYIIKEIQCKFGDSISQAWIDYACNGKTYNDIIKLYKFDNDFKYILKKIRKYISTEIKRDKYIINILNDIRMD